MANERCPWCGADIADEGLTRTAWKCGTTQGLYFSRVVARGHDCYERQIERIQPVYDAACEYEEQWHSNRNLQPYLHKLRVAVVSKETSDGK